MDSAADYAVCFTYADTDGWLHSFLQKSPPNAFPARDAGHSRECARWQRSDYQNYLTLLTTYLGTYCV